jgi:UDP-N-acetylglucosamine--N-acetylmuramyl-(pentapeptide) pyrophosphoryl-undecaprenol N-acetylglucosamine transferase
MLVPYPHAMDDHQTANAEVVVKSGGGWLIPEYEMSAGSLAGKIATLISSPEQLSTAAKAIRTLSSQDEAPTQDASTQDATDMIAKQIITLTTKGGRA